MNVEGPGDPGTVWLSAMVAEITPVLSCRENARGEAATGLSKQRFLPAPLQPGSEPQLGAGKLFLVACVHLSPRDPG